MNPVFVTLSHLRYKYNFFAVYLKRLAEFWLVSCVEIPQDKESTGMTSCKHNIT